MNDLQQTRSREPQTIQEITAGKNIRQMFHSNNLPSFDGYRKLTKQDLEAHILSVLKNKLTEQGKKFYTDASLNDFYSMIAEYFSNDASFEQRFLQTTNRKIQFSLRKGLFIMGSYGRSKSYIFNIILPEVLSVYNKSETANTIILHKIPQIREYRQTDRDEIFWCFEDTKNPDFEKFKGLCKTTSLYIDDFPIDKTVQCMGNKYRPLTTLITKRYDFFQKSPINRKTYITSNLDLKELLKIENFDDRFFSRIIEMFNIYIIGEGKNLRLL